MQYAEPGAEVLAELGGATLAAPAPVPQRLDPEAIGRLRTILMEYVKIDNLLGPRTCCPGCSSSGLHRRAAQRRLRPGRTELHDRGRATRVRGLAAPGRRQPPMMQWTNRALGWARAAEDLV